MKNRLRLKLTYANVIATIALFLALGGGAWAATAFPRNSVGSAQIKNGAVTGEKIRGGTLLASAFKAGELPVGTQGETGPQGEPGPQGETGPRGETGSAGKAGPEGEAGEPGVRGERGALGSQGEPGERGPRGETGEDGKDGARGERGAEGPEGEEGPRGPRGVESPEGERGQQGREGEAGITYVVTRYGHFVSPEKGPATSYAACKPSETVTGGGFDFLEAPTTRSNYVIQANRPSLFEAAFEEEAEEAEAVYPAPKNDAAATGWAVTVEATGERVSFHSYVMCAATGAAGGEEKANQELRQEGQQVLQLLR